MAKVIALHDIQLVPVVELEPWEFSTKERSSPSGSAAHLPEEWHRYWQDSLADAEITGLIPLRIGSWHVSLQELLEKPHLLAMVLAVFVNRWGGIEVFADADSEPVLGGGMALCQGTQVLAEPACCVDLGNWSDWKQAAAYRKEDWQILWIGHPWLSVRYEVPWLILSGPHESTTPLEQWAVHPDDLERAVSSAVDQLHVFSIALQAILANLGIKANIEYYSRKLAGLEK